MKVLELLKYSSMRLGIFVFVLTILEVVLTVGALFVIKSVVETVAGSED